MSDANPSLVNIDFNSCTSNLHNIRTQVRAAAEAAGCNEDLVQKLVLVIDEAIANVIRHAYQGSDRGEIRLRISQHSDSLWFELFDWAAPVDPECIKPRDLSDCRPGGLGVNFIDSVMDSWEFRRPSRGRGNVLVMKKKIG